MEVHQLAYFESVSRHLHFTRAAEELHVAQPSVSQQIRKLESELGTPLFHRMKRQVALTEAGKTFLPHARAVLRRLDEARVEVQELSGVRKGTLAVGVLRVVIHPTPPPALEPLPLLEEELLLVVPRPHALAGGSRRIPMAAL